MKPLLPSHKKNTYQAERLDEIFDEAENDIAPNATVWRKYVEETDRADKELVEGWNNSLDMLLTPYLVAIQAALFSAVSTAFVIESTKDLKPEPNEASMQAVTAVLIANLARSPPDISGVTHGFVKPPPFTPSRTAVVVNVLWFTSLGLSVGVALITILAKDWCYHFISGRTGPMLQRGRQRQLRWEGIERWKMREILNVLPLMMHAALLLFSIGLTQYLWNINSQVALPVVVITIIVGLFYLVTLFLPLFHQYCPFTTGALKFFHPFLAKSTILVIKLFLVALRVILGLFAFLWAITHCFILGRNPQVPDDSELESGSTVSPCSGVLLSCWSAYIASVTNGAQILVNVFMANSPGSQRVENKTPMDKVTSAMLGWMITQGESSMSIELGLKAIICADRWLPRHPLLESGALVVVLNHLKEHVATYYRSRGVDSKTRKKALRQTSLLFAQALAFISHVEGVELPQDFSNIVHKFVLLSSEAWNSGNEYDLVAAELGALSLHLDLSKIPSLYEKTMRQWKLVDMILSGKVSIPLTSVADLANGIAKSYLYWSKQSPGPLISLLDMYMYRHDIPDQVFYMIGVALSTACLTNFDYTSLETNTNHSSRATRAKSVYIQLTATEKLDLRELLAFGILGVMKGLDEWDLDIKLLGNLWNIWRPPNERLTSTILGVELDVYRCICSWVLTSFKRLSIELPPTSPSGLARVTDEDLPTGKASDQPRQSLMPFREHTGSPETATTATSRLNRSTQLFIHWSDRDVLALAKQLAETDTLTTLLNMVESAHHAVQPICMRLIWVISLKMFTIQGDFLATQSTQARNDHIADIKFVIHRLIRPGQPCPGTFDEIQLADGWIERIRMASIHNPRELLDSELLDSMIQYYVEPGNQDAKPCSTGGINGPERCKTWFQILRELRQKCEAAVTRMEKEEEAQYEHYEEIFEDLESLDRNPWSDGRICVEELAGMDIMHPPLGKWQYFPGKVVE